MLVSVEFAHAQALPDHDGHKHIVRPGQTTDAPKKPAFSWTGFHIGIGGGASFLRANSSVNSFVHQEGNNSNFGYFETYTANLWINRDLRVTGASGVVSFGYDYAVDNLLFGGFANFNLANLSANATTVDTTPSSVATPGSTTLLPATATLTHGVNLRSSVEFGARLGIIAKERILFYSLAGFSLAQIDAKSLLTVQHDPLSALANFSLGTEANGWTGGYTVGAGIEFAVTEKISLQTEYRYANYGKISSQNAVNLGPNSFATISQSDKVTNNTIRAVLNYHF